MIRILSIMTLAWAWASAAVAQDPYSDIGRSQCIEKLYALEQARDALLETFHTTRDLLANPDDRSPTPALEPTAAALAEVEAQIETILEPVFEALGEACRGYL